MSLCELRQPMETLRSPTASDESIVATVDEAEESDEELEEFNPYWRNQKPIMPIILSGPSKPIRTKSKGVKAKQPKKSQAEINGAYSLFARDQHDKSRINIYGERGMEFNATALPGHAKLIIKRSERFEKRHTNVNALGNSAEEQEDDETAATYLRKNTRGGNKTSLADYFSDLSSTEVNEPLPAWSNSPWAAKASASSQLNGVKNTLDCIDECLLEFEKASEDKEEQAQLLDSLVAQCGELETSLLSLLETNSDETITSDALSLLEKISQTRERYTQLR
eukprot:TRINITY_DN10578_c0_g1_i1.p1 TRINITY_DN10578_c0_g1~~TRINITY_DN10578_c0_g1_i1.p1  ORF type:complete len:280 (+),score=82.85 TRINITY_DN10578_c0_g1_i1:191-1030(+)